MNRPGTRYGKSMTLTDIQQALAQLGTRPKQSLGQNFLHDQNMCRWIVAQLQIAPGDHIVEIGPGLGSLTEVLQAEAAHLTLIEKDGQMVQWLRNKFAEPNVELFHIDALEFDLRKLYGHGPVRLAGNLPYYVSTPLIAKYTSALSPASILVLTVQHEVAERLGARPGTKEFGAMTVCVSRRWSVQYVKKIPPSVFFPQPQVSSAVVVFRRRPAADIPACDEALLESLVRRGFSERRKQLRNLLPEARGRWTEISAGLGIVETARAEELSLAQWEKMTQFLSPVEAQSASELFDVVDEQDRVIGSETRQTVHVNNLRHRAVHMVIRNNVGEIYLQKRSIWKDRNPGLWDSSAAGHVDAGETYQVSAQREISEELGIECALTPVGQLPCTAQTGWEFIEVYTGRHEGPMKPAPLEVECGAFFPITQVTQWINRAPEDFSPVFRQVFPMVLRSFSH